MKRDWCVSKNSFCLPPVVANIRNDLRLCFTFFFSPLRASFLVHNLFFSYFHFFALPGTLVAILEHSPNFKEFEKE